MGISIKGNKTEREVKQRMMILKNVVIFSESDITNLKSLASVLTDITVEKDDAVFHKGDRLNAMYIIVEGRVKVHDGDHVFTEFSSNDFFGEYSLIDSSVRSATVTAIEKTKLLRLDQADFHQIIEDNVEVSKAVLKALIKRLRNNNILEEQLTQNSLKIKRQRDKLDQQKKELEELNATKDKFFTIIAHDLKNPFNTVIGLAELLMERYDTYDTNKIKEFIAQIHKFSSSTYELLEDLLQWAKSQTGRMEVKPEKNDLFELVMDNIVFYKDKADKKGVILKSDIKMNTNAFIDKNMITAVLRNLISNAIKFTNPGDSIIIKANKAEEFIAVSVIDSGIGISEENRDKIFRIDSHISTQGTLDETGTGLGLIISKEFVEKNGGTISVQSNEGQGTDFTFSVPVCKE